MIPVLIFSSLKIGTFFVGGTILPQGDLTAMEYIQNNLLQYLVGSFTLAISAAHLWIVEIEKKIIFCFVKK